MSPISLVACKRTCSLIRPSLMKKTLAVLSCCFVPCFCCFLSFFLILFASYLFSVHQFSLPLETSNHVPGLLPRQHVLVAATLHLQLVLAHDGDAADTAVARGLRKVVVVVRITGIVTSAGHRVRDLDMILRGAALAEDPKGGGDEQHEGNHSDGRANAGFGACGKSRLTILLVFLLLTILGAVLRS